MRLRYLLPLACSGLACVALNEIVRESDVLLFDGATLDGWELTPFGGEGEIEVRDGALHFDFGSPLTGIHRHELPGGEALPRENYELECTAARVGGSDFFCGLTFPVGDDHATLILGGWGGALTGLSCIDGRDASDNETTSYRSFPPGRDVRVRLRVTTTSVAAWVDDEPIFAVARAGRRFGVRTEVLLSRPLGIASFQTLARVSDLRLRRLVSGTR